jgi:hypothetical protein
MRLNESYKRATKKAPTAVKFRVAKAAKDSIAPVK